MGDYFGTINELKHGLEASLPSKPEALILYEQIKEFGVPVVHGGIMDQPWIFMQEYKIVDNVVKQMEITERMNAANQQQGSLDELFG